ncbi:AMP-binding protein [soil metagenome]
MPFHFNGQAYTTGELKQHAQGQLLLALPAWELNLWKFVSAWLNDEPTITVHTSGSTGTPKSIHLPKDKVRNSALMTAQYLGLGQDSTALLSLSANYIAGKMMLVRAMENGWHLWATEPSNHPLQHLPETVELDLVAWVPSQLQAMLDLQNGSLNQRIYAIKNIILGGSPVQPQLAEVLKEFPNRVFETFGMTETISHIAMKRLSGPDAQGVFETTDDNIILGSDERDCLVIIAPLLADKPVITNDIIELKDGRHFRWLGRVDNVVNSGGIKLFPETLERKIQPLFTQRFFLAGVPDLQLGQKIILVLEGPELNHHQVEQLRDQLQTALTRYEMPRGIYSFSNFEETATKKVNRPATLKKLGLTQ